MVGITENMPETLTVMEALIPRFFDGAYETYFRNEELILMNNNKNPFRAKISEETRQILETDFSYEIRFYEFCKNRLKKQFNNLKVK